MVVSSPEGQALLLAGECAPKGPQRVNPDPTAIASLYRAAADSLPVVSAQNLKKEKKIIAMPGHPK